MYILLFNWCYDNYKIKEFKSSLMNFHYNLSINLRFNWQLKFNNENERGSYSAF